MSPPVERIEPTVRRSLSAKLSSAAANRELNDISEGEVFVAYDGVAYDVPGAIAGSIFNIRISDMDQRTSVGMLGQISKKAEVTEKGAILNVEQINIVESENV